MTATPKQEELASLLMPATIIPFLTIERLKDAVRSQGTLRSGVRTLEIQRLRTPVAIESAKRSLPRCRGQRLGIGNTCLNADRSAAAEGIGARFLYQSRRHPDLLKPPPQAPCRSHRV